MDIYEALDHACNLYHLPEDILDEIRAELPMYLWIEDHYEQNYFDGFYDLDPDEKARSFHCDACNSEWLESTRGRWKTTFKQGERTDCPKCGQRVTVKHLSRGFQTLRDVVDAVFYTRSDVDPNAIVFYAAHCVRDYGMADYRAPWTLDTDVDVRSIAVAVYGEGYWKFRKTPAAWTVGNRGMVPSRYEWKPVQSMKTMSFGTTFYANQIQHVVLLNSLEEAIYDTPFERAWDTSYLHLYNGQDGLLALSMIAKYPCIEYMTKFGWTDFLNRRLSGSLPPGLVNWRGRDMAHVLRLKKSRMAEIKGAKIPVSVELVAVLQWADKLGIRMGAKLARDVAQACHGDGGAIKARLTATVGLLPAGLRDRAVKYIAKAGRRSDVEDYWRDEAAIGGNLNDPAVAFPQDFRQAHQRTAARRKYAANSIFDADIKKRVKKLDAAYGFAFGGLVLRPAMSSAEVIREGEVLGHCVGGYVDKYAHGLTNIFVLRRAVEPDAPWRTVEIAKDGHVVQDRGYHNDWGEKSMMTDSYRAALDLFWRAWRERKIA